MVRKTQDKRRTRQERSEEDRRRRAADIARKRAIETARLSERDHDDYEDED